MEWLDIIHAELEELEALTLDTDPMQVLS